MGARVDVDTLEAKIRELCPNLPEDIRGFRAPKKKDKPTQPEIKVVTMAKEGTNEALNGENPTGKQNEGATYRFMYMSIKRGRVWL